MFLTHASHVFTVCECVRGDWHWNHTYHVTLRYCFPSDINFCHFCGYLIINHIRINSFKTKADGVGLKNLFMIIPHLDFFFFKITILSKLCLVEILKGQHLMNLSGIHLYIKANTISFIESISSLNPHQGDKNRKPGATRSRHSDNTAATRDQNPFSDAPKQRWWENYLALQLFQAEYLKCINISHGILLLLSMPHSLLPTVPCAQPCL